jgi:hypothetical protein
VLGVLVSVRLDECHKYDRSTHVSLAARPVCLCSDHLPAKRYETEEFRVRETDTCSGSTLIFQSVRVRI